MHDPACSELARKFLPKDAPETDVTSLAEHIQDSAEDWLLEKEDES